MKTSLGVAKPQHHWIRALKYNPLSQPSRWLSEWFPKVLLSSTIGCHSANQRLGWLIGRTSTATDIPGATLYPRLFPLAWMGDSYLGIIFGYASIVITIICLLLFRICWAHRSWLPNLRWRFLRLLSPGFCIIIPMIKTNLKTAQHYFYNWSGSPGWPLLSFIR